MIDFLQTRFRSIDPAAKTGKTNLSAGIYAVLVLWLSMALFADLISNELPLSCTIEGKRYYPALEESWSKIRGKSGVRIKYLSRRDDMESIWMPLIPYSPQTIDRSNAGYASPFANQNIKSLHYRHWLGTDGLGRDVLAGMIHGSRIALIIGVLSVLFAIVAGVLPGAFAGYFGDRGLKISLIQGVSGITGLFLILWLIYLGIDTGEKPRTVALWVLPLVLIFWLLPSLYQGSAKVQKTMFGKKLHLPLDLLLLRTIEIFRSLPSLFILLALLAIMHSPGILQMALILALLMWPTFARYTRAEFLALREQDFVAASRLLRKQSSHIIFRELLPIAVPPIAVAAAFGVSSAILAESTLSFLGIGFSAEVVSWGSMLNEARKYFGAWWLAVFPGLAIFSVVFAMNSIGDHVSKKYSGSQTD